jgi:anti-sigma factor RsiW
VIDEALRQLLTVQAQRHATLQAVPNLIQHVQSGEAQQPHILTAPATRAAALRHIQSPASSGIACSNLDVDGVLVASIS